MVISGMVLQNPGKEAKSDPLDQQIVNILCMLWAKCQVSLLIELTSYNLYLKSPLKTKCLMKL